MNPLPSHRECSLSPISDCWDHLVDQDRLWSEWPKSDEQVADEESTHRTGTASVLLNRNNKCGKTLNLVEIQVFSFDKWKFELGLWPTFYDIISREGFNICSFYCIMNFSWYAIISFYAQLEKSRVALKAQLRDVIP